MSITAPADKNLDAVVAALGELRTASGSPSYSEIASRIGALRSQAGRARRPPRSTVYDCFRPGRRRLDLELVRDILLALGLTQAEATAWLGLHELGSGHTTWSEVVDARLGPPPAAPLVGRRTELERMHRALVEARGPVLVEGMPGVGKSALAHEAARGLLGSGAVDVVVHADVRGSDPARAAAAPAAVCAAATRLLGGAPRADADLGAAAHALAATLGKRRLLLVLDDVSTHEHLALAGSPRIRVLATSRRRITLPAGVRAERVALRPLPAETSLELLRHVVGASRVDAEPDAARRIAAQVGGLPLALELTARRVASGSDWTLADHAEALARRHGSARLDDDVRSTFEVTYAGLGASARRTLRLLAVQPCAGLPADELTVLTAAQAEAAQRDADELRAAHLVVVDPAGRLRLHDLVRAFAVSASEDEDSPSERTAALHRLRHLWIERSWALHHALTPGAVRHTSRRLATWPTVDATTARTWLDRAAVDAVLLTDPGTDPGPEQVVELSEALGWAFSNYTRWRAARVLHARARRAARSAQDRVGELVAQLALARTATWLAEWDDAVALATGARRGLERLGEELRVAEATQVLAVVAAQTGRFEESAALFTDLLAAFERAGRPAETAMTRDNLANVLFRSGRVADALVQHQTAAAECAAAGDEAGRARALTNAADDLLALGRAQESFEAARAGREVAERCGDERTIAYAVTNMGSALTALGDPEAAAAHHDQGVALARSLGDVHLEASALNNLGVARLELGDALAAREAFTAADEIATRVEDPHEQERSRAGLDSCRQLLDGATAPGP